MLTKEKRTMSNRDLDKVKPELNGYRGDDDHEEGERVFSKRAKKIESSEVLGIAVPMNIDHPHGNLRCYLSLSPEIAEDEETLLKVIDRLVKRGYPIAFYRSKNENGGGGFK